MWWRKIVVIYHYYLTFRLSLTQESRTLVGDNLLCSVAARKGAIHEGWKYLNFLQKCHKLSERPLIVSLMNTNSDSLDPDERRHNSITLKSPRHNNAQTIRFNFRPFSENQIFHLILILSEARKLCQYWLVKKTSLSLSDIRRKIFEIKMLIICCCLSAPECKQQFQPALVGLLIDC